ncbi:MAG: ATP-binding cassette domain-containing protein [Roseomonas sp.]|nr:ATP-binding cassette domain-containing protein [Roseomonas sp.]MCA3291519.1 ATP-binding cassette domain-containing protein [Roseomonas sp.]MCA3294099.1 ATP-binding cassette domain-containing protein [Roseomonas sp.]MCA4919652.1 ATP-binding cassette domain-containing protein [Roseomonas sp.]
MKPDPFTLLLGASGAGRSTLLRSLKGLVRPTQGHILDSGGEDNAEARALRRAALQSCASAAMPSLITKPVR